MKMAARMITARVSRTWNSTRCSMTGIFLSSSGLKTESCSHRFSLFSTQPRTCRNLSIRRSDDRDSGNQPIDRSPDLLLFLLRINGHKQTVPLSIDQQHGKFVFLDLFRSLLIIAERLDRLVIDFLDHVTTLEPGCLCRSARLDRRDDYSGRLRGNVQLAHQRVIQRLDTQ